MKKSPRFNFASFDPRHDALVARSSGICLPLTLSLEQANDFINKMGSERAADFYEEDLMKYYSQLTNEEKSQFALKDRAIELIEQYKYPTYS